MEEKDSFSNNIPLMDKTLWGKSLNKIKGKDVLVYLLCLISASMVLTLFFKNVPLSSIVLMIVIIICLTAIIAYSFYLGSKNNKEISSNS